MNQKTTTQNKDYELQNKLIILFQKQNDDKSILKLISLYDAFLNNISKIFHFNYPTCPLMFEDYKQYSTYMFIERTKKYDFNKNMNFASYIEKFINFDLKNYARKYTSNNNKVLNYSSFNLEEEIHFKDFEINFSLVDLKTSNLNQKQKIIFKEFLKNGGNVKETSFKLKIPTKTLYRHKNNIIEKLKIINS